MVDSVVPGSKQLYKTPEFIPDGMFRTYDIRGEVGVNGLSEEVAYLVGCSVGAMASELGIRDVIVGRDARLSGPSFAAAVMQGLYDVGCNVIDIGVVSTPILYFATNHLSANTGVMVTASHNPGNHNGFKVVMNGQTLTTQGVQDILQLVKAQNFKKQSGSYGTAAVAQAYIDYIKARIVLDRPLKVVVDAGNGAGAIAGPALYRDLGCEVIDLYCELDGHFPNHHPDPGVPENLNDIIAKVKETGADLGIAFDGDADRIGLVTNKGEIIWPDQQIMLFARDVLKRYPDSNIVFDIKCSTNLSKVIKENGGNPIMYRTGHSLLKAKMIEADAPLAGEMSGHIFFRDEWFGFDDGVYVGARLLQLLASQNKALSELFDALPQSVNTPELKLPMAEDKKQAFMQQLTDEGDFGAIEVITIDGLRVEFEHGWGLVRPSNTSPYLTLRFEADTPENLDAIQQIFREQLLRVDSGLQLPF